MRMKRYELFQRDWTVLDREGMSGVMGIIALYLTSGLAVLPEL